MISGRQALGSIDQSLNQASDQINAVQLEITEVTERLIAEQKEQAEDYRNLARVRLGELAESSSALQHLDGTERQVVALLERREATQVELKRNIDENQRLRAQYEVRRQQQATRLDAAVAVVDQAEAATQGKLDADPDYREQRQRAEAAERKAMHAADKAARSEEEREEKGSAYKNDPLFSYLWERSYGLPAYAGRGLFRWLDGKVARLIGYADARGNYARLNEIPVRLREHANHLNSLADAEFLKLRQRDEIARAADGISELEENVAAEQEALDEIDRQIEELERAHQQLLEERARFAAGDDDLMNDAVQFLANEFQRDGLMDLRYAALNTPYPEDDVVVSRMLQREQEKRELETSVESLKVALKQHRDRLMELETLRADFKRKRFDRAGSVFANDSMVPMLLGEFLAGMLDRRMLWKALQEQQRYRPRQSDPGFGSGGFGRGTIWKGGLGDLGDIIGGIGRGGFGGGRGGGSGGGGGFRTGGGF